MSIGPYKTNKGRLFYKGNNFFPCIREIRGLKPDCSLVNRHLEIRQNGKKWGSLVRIWSSVFLATTEFMKLRGALLFDLPITTRMISSPGALTGTIPSDVDPFEINFFNHKTFLTQSSQLYLEFAITNPEIQSVFCWEKSFRREKADFRHLPEFTHVEFEGNINFKENLIIQKEYIQFLVSYIIQNNIGDLGVFLDKKQMSLLKEFSRLKSFEEISFIDAFKLLKEKTGDPKYNQPTIKKFGAYEEVLITEAIGQPVFITNFIENEVAFYHAKCEKNKLLAENADFLFPGYGEVIGSGQRVRTREETEAKANRFKLSMRDYKPYIESRDIQNPKIHSGWGMGIERFVQAVLQLPFIWEAKVFPRVHNQNHP
ncbi:MAG: Asparagine-tRNA ligase [Parcubacteria group bacterium GW2011_GWB1_42_6]|nr:MAG: Asparagine-tRNA ligase [Parcubacteria group bacterium GW2011_GWB1_42_6]